MYGFAEWFAKAVNRACRTFKHTREASTEKCDLDSMNRVYSG